MNVLSIDFEFFQNTATSLLKYYPEDINLSTEESVKEWEKIYNEHPVIKSEVKIPKRELYTLNLLLENQKDVEAIMIANSHKSAYKFINEYADKEKLHITNIDLHHDLVSNNKELDCGNWLGHMRKDFPCKIMLEWVANPVSKEMYGIKKGSELEKLIKESITEIKDKQYDLIFLCKSNAGIPPHLDKEFSKIAGSLKKVAAKNNSIFILEKDVVFER